MEDLTKSLVATAENPDVKAVVLTSSKFGIFRCPYQLINNIPNPLKKYLVPVSISPR